MTHTPMKLGISAKFNLLSVVLIVLTAVAIAAFVARYEERSSYEQLVNLGTGVATMIAENSEYGIYTRSEDELRRLVDSVAVYKDVAYISITDLQHAPIIQKAFREKVVIPTVQHAEQELVERTGTRHDVVNPGDGMSYISIIVPVPGSSSGDEGLFASQDDATGSVAQPVGHVLLGISLSAVHE